MSAGTPATRNMNYCERVSQLLHGFGIGKPSIYHALVVVFLEFFAWGLLTTPMIIVLYETFPNHTFLMNGVIVGTKGLLTFLSAPVIGALSDVWGRKLFLILSVFFTCAPIPLMQLNTWWYITMMAISGVFAVTFSVIFAYVADVIPDEQNRPFAFGCVSAAFAVSLVLSQELGNHIVYEYGISTVVALATAIAAIDVLFVLFAVPESLPRTSKVSVGTMSAWKQADLFAVLRKVGKDKTILLLCLTAFLSRFAEAGQYSSIFVYLRLVVGFKAEEIATLVTVIGMSSILAQTILIWLLANILGAHKTIVIGLLFQMIQLAFYGFGTQTWIIWNAGILSGLSSIIYPAISGLASTRSDPDKQGLGQGIVTGMMGLCNGLGPAVFGLIFYIFHVDLNEDEARLDHEDQLTMSGANKKGISPGESSNRTIPIEIHHHPHEEGQLLGDIMPGPPFVFGSLMVMLAIIANFFIPEHKSKRRQGDCDSDLNDLENSTHPGHNSQTMAPLLDMTCDLESTPARLPSEIS